MTARGERAHGLLFLFGFVGRLRGGLWSRLRRRRRGRRLADPGDVFGLHLRRGAVLAPDGVVNFLAMDAHLARGVDPQPHLVAADVHHGDFDVVADHDRLVALTGQNQHKRAPSWEREACAFLRRVSRKGPGTHFKARDGPRVAASLSLAKGLIIPADSTVYCRPATDAPAARDVPTFMPPLASA